MYSVLLKIPDKLNKLETKESTKNETNNELKDRTEANTLNNRTFNYYTLFCTTCLYG